MDAIKDSLTFDDVALVPQYSSVLPSETITSTKLANNLILQTPLISSAMDTVTESEMAIALSKSGGIGIIHRNLSIEKQVREVKKVKKNNFLVGAAIGVNSKDIERADELSKAFDNSSALSMSFEFTPIAAPTRKLFFLTFLTSLTCFSIDKFL